MKKVISLVLAVLMTVSVCSVCAFALDNNCSVAEYLVAPSQYTNNASFGKNIENTVNGKSSVVSLGNFGGYVTYKFDKPVMNNKNNLYGIDFIVYGNAFAGHAGAAEPGQVWVSRDGEKWYAIAGSEHYEDSTIWDYSVTYINNGTNKCDFVDSLGDSGVVSTATASQYPLAENYPTVSFGEDSLTLSGILIKKERVPSTNTVVETSFGYVDSKLTSRSDNPSNPYLEDPVKNCFDGQFDISLAVDENGMPANLDSVSYVKVQTATFIDSAVFGEKSTEIGAIMIAQSEENSVGKTAAPEKIVVGGHEIKIEEGKYVYNLPLKDDTAFDVNVVTDAQNVYINNSRGASRVFESKPDKNIIRIIVQNENAEPVVYYINTDGDAQNAILTAQSSVTVSNLDEENFVKLDVNGENLVFLSSDNNIVMVTEDGTIIPQHTGTAVITVTNGKDKITVTVTVTGEDKEETENDEPVKLSFFEKIRNWFMNIIEKIRALFKK